jgi:methionine synthase II (cobalamin-independent)
MDPFTLLAAAQATAAMIRRGCELLNDGKAEIQKIKRTVEDVKATVNEVIGLWDTIKDLWFTIAGVFGVKKPAAPVAPTPVAVAPAAAKPAAKPAKGKAADPDYEEFVPSESQMIADVARNLGKFFKIQEQLQNYYLSMEETSLHVYDPNANHAERALERIVIETQMEQLGAEIRHMMVYESPPQLKDLYTRFQKMYGRIQDEQDAARREMLEKARREREAKQREEGRKSDERWILFGVVTGILYIWWLIWQAAEIKKTHFDFLSG